MCVCVWYPRELAAVEEGRDMVAGKFQPPRSPAEIERFRDFVHAVVNNASITVVESPTTQGTQDVPPKLSPVELEEFQNCGTINGTRVPPVVIRQDDGAELVVGPDGEVYEVDAEVHKDVNEFGFDRLGRFFPLKGMSEVYLLSVRDLNTKERYTFVPHEGAFPYSTC